MIKNWINLIFIILFIIVILGLVAYIFSLVLYFYKGYLIFGFCHLFILIILIVIVVCSKLKVNLVLNHFSIIHFSITTASLIVEIIFLSIPNYRSVSNSTSNATSTESILSTDILPFYYLSIERFELFFFNFIIGIINYFSAGSVQLISVTSLKLE